MKLTLYIYNAATNEVVATYQGSTNEECESQAEAANWGTEEYGWTYTASELTFPTSESN